MNAFTLVILAAYFVVKATSNKKLCVDENTSCSYQIWGDESPENWCQVIHETAACIVSPLPSNYKQKRSLGKVQLVAYPYEGNYATVVGAVLNEISWKRLYMRVVEEGSGISRFCKIFTISENATVPTSRSIEYSCPWSFYNEQGKTFTFEYSAHLGHTINIKKYIFKLPTFNDFDAPLLLNRELFVYVDYTDTMKLTVRVQTLPTNFNVTEYRIQVWRQKGDHDPQCLDERPFYPTSLSDNEISMDFYTYNVKGKYFFKVFFMSEECRMSADNNVCGRVTESPKIFVGRKSNVLVIGIVGASVIIPMLLYTLFIWNKQCRIQDTPETEVLLVYIASTEAHNNVVLALERTLRKVFNLKVFLDVRCIPETKHKNPLQWLSEVFKSATHIVYVISPNAEPDYPSIYKTEPAAVRLIEEEIGSGIIGKKLCLVGFPYAKTSAPECLGNFKKFQLTRDFSKFVSFLLPYDRHSLVWYKNVFKRNSIMYYHEREEYRELVEKVARAQDGGGKRVVVVVKPHIAITLAKEDPVKSDDETKKLIDGGNEDCSYDIRKLNLSGDEENYDHHGERPKLGINVHEMDL